MNLRIVVRLMVYEVLKLNQVPKQIVQIHQLAIDFYLCYKSNSYKFNMLMYPCNAQKKSRAITSGRGLHSDCSTHSGNTVHQLHFCLMMAQIRKTWQKFPKFPTACRRIQFGHIQRVMLFFKAELRKLKRNPTVSLIRLLYLLLSILSKTSPVPLTVKSKSGSETLWGCPRLEAREGVSLGLVIGFQVLLASRSLLGAFFACTQDFQLKNNGLFTLDALMCLAAVLMVGGVYIVAGFAVINRHGIALLFNSCVTFGESYSRKLKSWHPLCSVCPKGLFYYPSGKNFGKRTALVFKETDKWIIILLLFSCGSILQLPFATMGLFVHLRHSPIALVYHFPTVPGIHGIWAQIIYVALLLIDSVWMTVLIFGCVFFAATLCFPLLGIMIVIRSVRYFFLLN